MELGGRGDSVVCGGDDIVGEVDPSSAGWLWQRDQLIGRDLAGSGPDDAFVAGLALLDRDLGLSLGPHADDARRRGEAWVVGCGVPDDVGDVDRGDQAEVKDLDRFSEVDAASELVGRGPSGRVGGGGRDRGADLAGCTDQRDVGAAGWVGEFASVSLPSSTPPGWPPAPAPAAG